HTRFSRDWSSDVCSSDLIVPALDKAALPQTRQGRCHRADGQRGAGMMEFVWPWVFLALPLPLLLNRLVPRAGNREAALYVPFFRSEERRVGRERSAGALA